MRGNVALVVFALLVVAGGWSWGRYGSAIRTQLWPSRRPDVAPADVVRQLWEMRARRAYSEMRPLIEPGRARDTTELLSTIDAVLVAERNFREYVRENVGYGVSEMMDLSSIGENLGIFSTNAELLDTNIEGAVATVSFLVNGRLPTRTARLVRDGASWRYDPEGGFEPDLPKAFRLMTEGYRRMIDDLKSGRIDARRAWKEPEYLGRELSQRVGPGLSMIRRPGSAPASP